jgi:hypothetical protein
MKESLTKKEVPFTLVANAVLNDENLSWKAKGVFAYLYSKPENWDFSGKRICLNSSDGLTATYSALKELEKAGYLSRKKTQTGRTLYTITYTKTEENRKQLKPQTGETRPINKIDLKNKIEYIHKGKFLPPGLEEVRLYCKERRNGIDPEAFIDCYESKGWMIGRTKMKNWQAAVRTWEKRNKENQPNKEQIIRKMIQEYGDQASFRFEEKYGIEELRKYQRLFFS